MSCYGNKKIKGYTNTVKVFLELTETCANYSKKKLDIYTSANKTLIHDYQEPTIDNVYRTRKRFLS